MKPTILVDVDGVLADFTQAALDLVYMVTGKQHKPSQITKWEVFDSIQEPEAKKEVYRILRDRGGCTAIPPCDGAKEGLAKLREIANVVIVTSPFKGSEVWAYERELWLYAHFGIHVNDVIHAHRKERIHGDLFLDDKPKHVKDWFDYWVGSRRDINCVGILWRGRAVDEPVPVGANLARSWDDVRTLVEIRASMR